jgi:alcohol dehydrogenase, propanol-preferring
MKAMLLEQIKTPLREREIARPRTDDGQVVVRVLACAVCRTDLHVVDGELPNPKLPLVPGHEIVGEITEVGAKVRDRRVGERVGIPWLASTCGCCGFCNSGRENLCDRAEFIGYNRDGGYAEFALAEADFCFPLPGEYGDVEAAPLLCAGLIGYRSLAMAGKPTGACRLGIYGFGAAAQIVTQLACWQDWHVHAFTRAGDTAGQAQARQLGAVWAGGSNETPPGGPLEAAIIFAPVGALVPAALRAVAKGGRVICGGIHMSDIPGFPYEQLWGERSLRSVANLTRADAREFLALAPQVPIRLQPQVFPMHEANQALAALRNGTLTGPAVLVPRW